MPVTHTIAEVRAEHAELEAGQETDAEVGVAGRVVFQRNTGKLCFATLQDGEGRRLQAMLSLAEVGQESLEAFKADVDLGDHLFVHGRVISSQARRAQRARRRVAAGGQGAAPAARCCTRSCRRRPGSATAART